LLRRFPLRYDRKLSSPSAKTTLFPISNGSLRSSSHKIKIDRNGGYRLSLQGKTGELQIAPSQGASQTILEVYEKREE